MQIKNQTVCIGCGEAITNPVCPSCLDRNISEWSAMNGVTIGVKPLRKDLGYTDVDGTRCIKCGDNMHFCPYCYTEDVLVWLQYNKPGLVDEFMRFFNFDLGGHGYSKCKEFNSLLLT